ncbi:MAG TPA: UDP-N-acetylglucosamine--N-acetylmuramyl-(pentapeptide) pyrophosphoryl-undecaprenol N-acetylglucosamine transferase [Longimicrobiales bacterium]|nr:UDP-N-acetylglucosamine--N-acetylmuramyl-(pentapeptide) pyrophosphoryl-undecaprenol N-acetylglucosamine transferase [Longimicrobiales bacterium]
MASHATASPQSAGPRVIFAGGGTGGHLYPALNIAAAMRALRPGLSTSFVGARRGVEARVLPEKGVRHTLLPLEPIRRDRVWENWRLVPALSRSAWGLSRLMLRERPSLVVGTGGYASGPACGWALLVGVPIALQEQNSFPGLTTRWLSRFARQVHLGFPEAARLIRPGSRTLVTDHGNPIQAPDTSLDRREARRAFGLSPDATVLLVVGGSQGSRAVNQAMLGAIEAVAEARAERPGDLEVLWATGPAHIDGIRERLVGHGVEGWVHPVGYIDAMPKALASADVAVSRAGAMGTAELLAWGVPSILVPLPTAAADHQTHNARALEEDGAAVALAESELTPGRLWENVCGLAGDPSRRSTMAERARARARPEAARRIAEDLLRIVEGG